MDRRPPVTLPAVLAGAVCLTALVLLAAGCATSPRPLAAGDGAAIPGARDAADLLRQAAPDVSWPPLPVVTADLDGDGTRDQAYLGRTAGAVVLGLVPGPSTHPGPVRLIRLAVDGHRPGTLCTAKVTVTPERVAPPLDKLGCTAAGAAPGCAGVRAGAAFARAHPGVRGLRIAGGPCKAFHVYWDPSSSDFAWWRR